MQSTTKHITTSTPTNFAYTGHGFHVKVQHNDETRRFVLDTICFATMEKTVRKCFSIEDTKELYFTFQDDENDWVLLSSDDELKLAFELTNGALLRLSFDVSKTKTEPKTLSEVSPAAQNPSLHAARGRAGAPFLSKQDRLELKSARLSERIRNLEDRLANNAALPSDRQRVLRWRLGHLKIKLDNVNERKAELEKVKIDGIQGRGFGRGRSCGRGRCNIRADALNGNAELPVFAKGWGKRQMDNSEDDTPVFGRRNGRGRCCRQRGLGLEVSVQARDFEDSKFHPFHQLRTDLRVARKSGNQEAIESCEAALKQARQLRKASLAEFLGPKRAHKRECFLKYKEAQKSGDEKLEKESHEALVQAIEDLKATRRSFVN